MPITREDEKREREEHYRQRLEGVPRNAWGERWLTFEVGGFELHAHRYEIVGGWKVRIIVPRRMGVHVLQVVSPAEAPTLDDALERARNRLG